MRTSRHFALNIRLLGGLAVMAFGLATTGTAFAKDHVLIMTISDYPAQPLAGVKHDATNALRLAEKLGYDTSNAVSLKDSQLTKAGLSDALARLADSVDQNERVFIYYSGHGASLMERGQCVQSLVGRDSGLLSMTELVAQIDRIKSKSPRDVLVVTDACHSGGLGDMAVTRSFAATSSGSSQGISPKVFVPKNGESCQSPMNVGKSWVGEPVMHGARSVVQPQNNFTFIAAANEREVALDDSEHGGLATVSLLKCLDSGVPDLDGSGIISTKELLTCAQKQIASEVPKLNARKGTHWAAHTVEGFGNVERALNDVKATQAVQTSIPSGIANRAQQTIAALKQIEAGSNGNWALAVQPSANAVSLKEADPQRVVRFPYTSSQAGYGYVLYVGTDGRDMKQLYPDPGENNYLPAASQFPALRIEGPAGANTYLFVLSQVPRDLTGVFAGQGGAAATSDLSNVQCEFSDKRNSVRLDPMGPCARNRNSVRVDPAAISGPVEGYAAQMLVVEGR